MHAAPHGFGQPAGVDWQEKCAFLKHARIEIGGRRRAMDDRDVGKLQVHLLGHKGGKGGVDALAHFGARGHNCHAIGVDHHIRVQRRRPLGQIVVRRVAVGRLVFPPANSRAPGEYNCPEQKYASDDFSGSDHVRPLSCAKRHP